MRTRGSYYLLVLVLRLMACMEYASIIWDPHFIKDRRDALIERVQKHDRDTRYRVVTPASPRLQGMGGM